MTPVQSEGRHTGLPLQRFSLVMPDTKPVYNFDKYRRKGRKETTPRDLQKNPEFYKVVHFINNVTYLSYSYIGAISPVGKKA